MANFVVQSSEYRIGGYRFTGDTVGITLSYEADAIDSTTMSSGGKKTFLPGLKQFTLEHEGLFNAAASIAGIDGQHFTAVGVQDTIISVSQEDGVEGTIGYAMKGIVSSHNPSGSIGEILDTSLSLQGSEPLVRGTIMANDTGVTEISTNTTGFQLGAVSSAQTIYFIAHLTADSGNQTVTMDLNSDDNSGFTSEVTRATLTFTGGGNMLLGQMTSVAGAITDDWWRINTVAAGGETFDFYAIAGIL